MDTKKTCSCCGKEHNQIPNNARIGDESLDQFPGYYWECDCKSTLFVPKQDNVKKYS